MCYLRSIIMTFPTARIVSLYFLKVEPPLGMFPCALNIMMMEPIVWTTFIESIQVQICCGNSQLRLTRTI